MGGRVASPTFVGRIEELHVLEFQLRTARSFGRSQLLATVTVGESLSAEQTEGLRFNPWITGPDIRPSGWLNLLRDAAYRASQRGRL
jgi:hypothetical protein